MRWFGSASVKTPNDVLVDELKSQGTLVSPDVIAAFRHTDRGHFLKRSTGDNEGEVLSEDAYLDMPLRHGLLHLSAPSIYATALEALELRPGQSFLNVGSGTGYLSALAASLIGRHAVHYGIECRDQLVRHSRERLRALGHETVELVHCNCFFLDPESSMRFDRIYVGAGGSSRTASLLFRMVVAHAPASGPNFCFRHFPVPQALPSASLPPPFALFPLCLSASLSSH